MATIPRKRRGTRLSERLTPCFCCAYPISQRHHLFPAARYGETGKTVALCANCHEAYHILEQGWIDIRASRRNTHAIYLYDALWRGFGGRENPIFDAICCLVEQSDRIQQDNVAPDILDMFDHLFGPEIGNTLKDHETVIRRGDTVRLTNDKIVRVVSTQGGYIHTTDGTYGPWQVAKVAKWE